MTSAVLTAPSLLPCKDAMDTLQSHDHPAYLPTSGILISSAKVPLPWNATFSKEVGTGGGATLGAVILSATRLTKRVF